MCDQMPDKLIINGNSISIAPLPIKESENVIYTPVSTMTFSTAHQRGYVAFWEIIDQKLYLTKIEGCYQLKFDKPLFADWVTGQICLAAGSYGRSLDIFVENGYSKENSNCQVEEC